MCVGHGVPLSIYAHDGMTHDTYHLTAIDGRALERMLMPRCCAATVPRRWSLVLAGFG
jgi:hypothetical protein